MATTSRLNRVLQNSFRIYSYYNYFGNNFYYSGGESVTGNNGLYSKFIKVKVRNFDGTFELPICALGTFYNGIENFVKSGKDLVTSNESYELLAPIHCNNISNPYRAATIETAFMDNASMNPYPFGVSKVEIISRSSINEVKETYYQAPGLILDEHFQPLMYSTVIGRFTDEIVEYTEFRVYVAHRVFLLDNAISKFLLKKVVPFYLYNEVYTYKFITNRENGVSIRSSIIPPNGGEYHKVKVILEPLDNLVLSVKTPDSYEAMEENVYTILKSEGALDEMFDLDKMFL